MRLKNQVTYSEARKTSLVVAAVLGVVALIGLYRESVGTVWVAGSLAFALVLIGLLIPALAIMFHRAWMTLAFALGWVNSRIILTLVYVLLFIPYRLISRLAGRDPLSIRGKGSDSYWTKRARTRQSKQQFERLF